MSEEIPKIYDPKTTEKKWQDFWEKEKIYAFNPDSEKPVFSVDTPPPYISADSLHVGHAMSYTQAEIIVRYHRMRGENIFYPMGFDDNGLPTERYVEKKYKVDKLKITRKEFVELCLKETVEGGKLYEKLWRSLGLSVDWSLLYSTINPLAQKIAQRSFIDLYNKKRIYREESPTFWCTHCQTALAQAELEDEEQTSIMYDIAFSSEDRKDLIISTTRPELIPACVALYFNPKDKRYASLKGKSAIVPITGDKVSIKTSDAVEMDKGTGLMMVCTWGDADDIEKWRTDKLDTKLIIEKGGRINNEVKKYEGLTLTQAREKIVSDLEKNGLLKGKNELKHAVNIHERCKHPIDFFVSPQWFIKILDIKEELSRRGGEIQWFPKFMKVHLDHWIEGLKWDWCISRERYYGVPFPVWHCRDCGEIILPEDKELPVDPREQKPPAYRQAGKNKNCPQCESQKIIGEMQVMDTWMTSSVTPLINARWQEKENLMKEIYPMSLRVQAFEIIRTWLFYTLAKSHFHTNSLPWKSVMISGWGLARDGEKMSKSLGNFIPAENVINQYGADALRFWACGATLGMNLRYSEEDTRAGKKLLTKIWNATRFAMMNLEDYDKKTNLNKENLNSIDRWILAELQELIKNVTLELNNYEFAKAKNYLEHFFWINFTDNYIELVKNRLYGDDKKKKISAQFTLYTIISTLTRLFAPILPHITEEVYQTYLKDNASPQSVHLSNWLVPDKKFEDKGLVKQTPILINVISQMRKLKTEKSIKLSEKIRKISISVPREQFKFIKESESDLKELARAEKIETSESKNKASVSIH